MKFSCVVIISIINLSECMRNNVCRTFRDYKFISQKNSNCWYDPDVGASPAEVSLRYGYPFETYNITSQDGYIVNLYRIPNNGSEINRKRPPVLLQHGIAVDSASWMLLGKDSLAFFLADNGFDVWLINARGTDRSPKHTKYTIFQAKFWDFSFHEMAVYDVPLIVDLIVSKTGQKITYIGHSMGSTIALVYSSLKKSHAEKNLNRIIALAPVAYMHSVTGPVLGLVPFRNLIYHFLRAVGLFGFGLNIEFKTSLIHLLCGQYPFIILCSILTAAGAGLNVDEVIIEGLPKGFSHYPSGFSLKTILHYAQIIDSRQFQLFDYGSRNSKIYNSKSPPKYPISEIRVPINIFYGKKDALATEKDVKYLYDELQTEKTIQEVFNIAHNDFLAGRNAIKVYNLLLKYLPKQY